MKPPSGDLPLVVMDSAISSESTGALDDVAEQIGFEDERSLDRLIEDRGPEVVGLGIQLTTEVDRARLDRLPAIRIVANCAVGYDNIDVEAAAARGIIVTNTPGVLTEATADLTWALILSVARRVVEGDALVRSGGWTGWDPALLLGHELHGRTLAILGLGRIGAAVARRGASFGMDVVYWSRNARLDLERDHGFRRVDLETALTCADVVSVHLPLSASTRHLIDGRRLALMKATAILVNTSRGSVVNEADLAKALATGTVAGAGLDVYENEPRVHPDLLASPRAVLLPHLGSATRATRKAMAHKVAENLRAVLSGEPAVTPIDAQAGAGSGSGA